MLAQNPLYTPRVSRRGNWSGRRRVRLHALLGFVQYVNGQDSMAANAAEACRCRQPWVELQTGSSVQGVLLQAEGSDICEFSLKTVVRQRGDVRKRM